MKITVSLITIENLKQFKVTFPYNAEFIIKIKMIQDAFWHKELKSWTLPFNIENYVKLKSTFENDQIRFEEDIIAFFEKKVTKLDVRIELQG